MRIALIVIYTCIQFSAGYGQLTGNCCLKNFSITTRTTIDTTYNRAAVNVSREGMVWIEAGTFEMGCTGNEGRPDEYPVHKVTISGFWMDSSEVTNAQFAEFVGATGYVTTAEQAFNNMEPASFVFKKPKAGNEPWWELMPGANWKHPLGPGSDLVGKEYHPVVHISWYDAQAYCNWVGKRLPTEAEWEYAARGMFRRNRYPWGNENIDQLPVRANIWQGQFPIVNTRTDGFERAAPVGSYPANALGLYDMAGNVWEWCSDWYATDYYDRIGDSIVNPSGPLKGYDVEDPTIQKKVIRGGSFLCHASYCSSYRVSARMKVSPETSLEHTGFRCVADASATPTE